MPHEAFVQLSCPECSKTWEETPSDLPAPDDNYGCPACDASARTSEFLHTNRDLETLKQLQE